MKLVPWRNLNGLAGGVLDVLDCCMCLGRSDHDQFSGHRQHCMNSPVTIPVTPSPCAPLHVPPATGPMLLESVPDTQNNLGHFVLRVYE